MPCKYKEKSKVLGFFFPELFVSEIWLAGWLTGSLSGWLAGWLADWLGIAYPSCSLLRCVQFLYVSGGLVVGISLLKPALFKLFHMWHVAAPSTEPGGPFDGREERPSTKPAGSVEGGPGQAV